MRRQELTCMTIILSSRHRRRHIASYERIIRHDNPWTWLETLDLKMLCFGILGENDFELFNFEILLNKQTPHLTALITTTSLYLSDYLGLLNVLFNEEQIYNIPILPANGVLEKNITQIMPTEQSE